MLRETENWTVKRQVSPESRKQSTEKLEQMQENLKFAANTIDALRAERERLKDSLKIALRSSPAESEEGRGSKREREKKQEEEAAVYWKSQVYERDKRIEYLEGKFQSSRVEKGEWEEMHSKYAEIRAEMLEKDRYIASLEKRLKGDGDAEVKFELNQRTKDLEQLNTHLKVLLEEKEQWSQLYDLLVGLAPGYLKTKSLKQANAKTDWQRFMEIIINLHKAAEGNKRQKEEVEETGKRFRLDPRQTQETHNALFYELREAVSVLSEKVHFLPQWHYHFKHRLVCTKRFKAMIDGQEFPEALLRVLRFVIDVINETLSAEDYLKYRQASPPAQFYSTTPQKKRNKDQEEELMTEGSYEQFKANEDKRYRVMTPYKSESSFKQTCWTQTSNMSAKSPLALSELNQSKRNKGLQTTVDKSIGGFASPRLSSRGVQSDNASVKSQLISEDSSRYRSYSKEQQRIPSKSPLRRNLKTVETSTDKPNVFTESSKSSAVKEEGYIKLFDESHQLLSIIDKQNSRLARINNQISQLVPNNRIEMILEKEEPSESSNFVEYSKYSHKYKNSNPGAKTIEYENGTFNKPEVQVSSTSINTSDNVRSVVKKYTEPYSEKKSQDQVKSLKKGAFQAYRSEKSVYKAGSAKYRSPPRAHPPLERPGEDTKVVHSSVERSVGEYGSSNRFKRFEQVVEYESDEMQASGKGKRSGLESSALRIPSKDLGMLNDSKGTESPGRRYLSPKDLESGRKHTWSPDPSSDRFQEYSRPKLRQEDCWHSVADYFSGKPDESSKHS